ncbi:hypothetical protein FGO68_gene3068 [Halteria grandinella]|uniref:Uncharacterized protein n=1 Tax=Halteria grandinella TaxID=5974 RepID=A0A8J8SXK1_HALGN|nr:hypothetical protein FGO68_gene3068 [Halteria grandinella]
MGVVPLAEMGSHDISRDSIFGHNFQKEARDLWKKAIDRSKLAQPDLPPRKNNGTNEDLVKLGIQLQVKEVQKFLEDMQSNNPKMKKLNIQQPVVVLGDKPLYISRSKVNLSVVSSRDDLKQELQQKEPIQANIHPTLRKLYKPLPYLPKLNSPESDTYDYPKLPPSVAKRGSHLIPPKEIQITDQQHFQAQPGPHAVAPYIRYHNQRQQRSQAVAAAVVANSQRDMKVTIGKQANVAGERAASLAISSITPTEEQVSSPDYTKQAYLNSTIDVHQMGLGSGISKEEDDYLKHMAQLKKKRRKQKMIGKEITAPIQLFDEQYASTPLDVKVTHPVRRSNNVVIESNKSKFNNGDGEPQFLSGWEIPPFDPFNQTGMMIMSKVK